MLFVEQRSTMEPEQIAKVMEDAFSALGRFVGAHSIKPSGPPLAIYSDWNETDMKIEVGFPVREVDLEMANDQIRAGRTPTGRCLRAIHHGPYDRLHETYARLEADFAKAHMQIPARSWEVYVSDPDITAPDELITEIYMPLP